jgi:hypothetical protein
MSFEQINTFILDIPVYAINGLLWLLYGLAGSMAALVSAGAAAVMGLVVDQAVQQLSSSRPLRQGRGESQPITRTAQILTTGVLTLWLGAQWGMGAPVPWIGAAMWLFGLGAVLVSPAQRFNLLWFVKFLVLMEFVVLTKMRQNWLKLHHENRQNASTTVYQRKDHHYKPN